jgi:hypothetical protein
VTKLIVMAVAGVALAGGLAWLIRAKRHDSRWRPLLPGLAGTCVGAWLLVAAYLWFFDAGSCDGRVDIACVLNTNQGALAAVALVLSIAALWATALNRHFDRLAAQRAETRDIRAMLLATMEETVHNLYHFAVIADERGVMHSPPNMSLRNAQALMSPRMQPLIHPVVLRTVETLLRVESNLQRFAAAGDGPGALRCYESIIRHSLRLLVLTGVFHGQLVGRYLEHPGFRDLKRAVGAMREQGDVWTSCMSRDALADAAHLRTYNIPVLCWIADEPVPDVELLPQFRRFRDLPGIPTAL